MTEDWTDVLVALAAAGARIMVVGAWEERVERQVAGRSVPFLGRETLIRNKRAVGG